MHSLIAGVACIAVAIGCGGGSRASQADVDPEDTDPSRIDVAAGDPSPFDVTPRDVVKHDLPADASDVDATDDDRASSDAPHPDPDVDDTDAPADDGAAQDAPGADESPTDTPVDIEPGACPVARAASIECGRVLVWGDDHVLMQSHWPAQLPFWQNAIHWLATATTGCGSDLTTVRFSGGAVPAELVTALKAEGLDVTTNGALPAASDPPSVLAIELQGSGFLPAQGAALLSWVKAGGRRDGDDHRLRHQRRVHQREPLAGAAGACVQLRHPRAVGPGHTAGGTRDHAGPDHRRHALRERPLGP